MIAKNRFASAALAAAMSLAAPLALGTEPSEDMRTLAAIFAALEAHDQPAYCKIMRGEPYAAYLGRVCQSAVQNKLKQAEDCTAEKIAELAGKDNQQCLTMTRADFEKTVLRSHEARKTFVEQTRAQGVDGEKLLQDARANIR